MTITINNINESPVAEVTDIIIWVDEGNLGILDGSGSYDPDSLDIPDCQWSNLEQTSSGSYQNGIWDEGEEYFD